MMPMRRHTAALSLLSLAVACGGDGGDDSADTADVGAEDSSGGDVQPDLAENDAATDEEGSGADTTPEPDTQPDAGDDTATEDADAPPDPVAALAVRGPHNVAYRSVPITYERPDGRGERAIRLAVWYPTNDEPGRPPMYFGIFRRPGIVADGAPALDAPAPTMIYSHGHLGYPESSGDFVEQFASHGWVVVAPEHTGNTLRDMGVQRAADIYHIRSADMVAALDWLEARPSDDPLSFADTDRVVASGHSFGGYTVATLLGAAFDQALLDSCEAGGDGGFCDNFEGVDRARLDAGLSEPRFVAGIMMDSGDYDKFGADGVAEIDRPLFFMSAGRGEPGSNAERYWAALQNVPGSARLDVFRACHQTFAIGCSGPGEIPAADGFRIVNVYGLSFALARLLGDDAYDGILSGEVAVSPDEAAVYAAAP